MPFVYSDPRDGTLGQVVTDLPEGDVAKNYVRLVQHFPEDYLERFPELLGPSQIRKEGDGLAHQYFPVADFSERAVRDELVRLMKYDIQRALAGSDWQVVRSLERGVPVHPDVAAYRQRVLAQADALEAEIQQLPPERLATHSPVYTEVRNGLAQFYATPLKTSLAAPVDRTGEVNDGPPSI